MKNKLTQLQKYMGPAFLIIMGCLDPGNISGDIAMGQKTVYYLLWVLLLSSYLYLAFQYLAIFIGVETRKSISQLCRLNYSRNWNVFLWVMTELTLLASDTQELLGTAIALEILLGLNTLIGILVTSAMVVLFLQLEKRKYKLFEWFFMLCIGLMGVCFAIDFFKREQDEKSILWGFVPTINHNSLQYATSLIGAILMPQNLHLHSSLVANKREASSKSEKSRAIHYYKLETQMTVVISFIINLTIICTFANCQKDGPLIELSRAGDTLATVMGGSAKIVWGLGLLSAGFASTVTGVLSGQFAIEGFLDIKVDRSWRLLVFRLISFLPCFLIIRFQYVEVVNIALNVVQFVQLPFVVIPMFRFIQDPSIMPLCPFVPKKLLIIQNISVVIFVINCTQLLSYIPQDTLSLVFFALFISVYVYLLHKLWTMELKVPPHDSEIALSGKQV